MIILDIDFSAIPKEKLNKANNGHTYGKVVCAEMKQPDKYGNTHTIYMMQSKEEREERADRIYIGKGKEYGGKRQDNQPSGDMPF